MLQFDDNSWETVDAGSPAPTIGKRKKETMKTNNAKLANGKPIEEANSLVTRALETQKSAEAARKKARLVKARFKQARKAFKQAKKTAREARKEAKLVAKALNSQQKFASRKISVKAPARNRPKAKVEKTRLVAPRILVKKPSASSSLVQGDAPAVSDTGPAPSSRVGG